VLFPLQLAGAIVLLELGQQRGMWSLSRGELAAEGALVCLAMLLFLRRPVRFALGFLVLLLLGRSLLFTGQTTLYEARTFFGVHRVARVQPPPEAVNGQTMERKPFHLLIHGTTRHGAQYPDPQLRRFATAYYHPSGPIGEVFAALGGDPRARRVGIVGLGTGTLAAYGGPDRYLSFYELDPEVVRIAKDPALFTYLAEAPGPVDVVVGDGRLSLAATHDGEFGLLVLDAFSSDAIPVHLLTREAVAVYLRKLQPNGLLAFHVSNHYLDLPPILAALAKDLGLVGRVRADAVDSQLEVFELKSDSTWVVLARRAEDLAPVTQGEGWRSLPAPSPRHLWTDQRSSLLPVLKWTKR
jgi:spermidine synthase